MNYYALNGKSISNPPTCKGSGVMGKEEAGRLKETEVSEDPCKTEFSKRDWPVLHRIYSNYGYIYKF